MFQSESMHSLRLFIVIFKQELRKFVLVILKIDTFQINTIDLSY
jgi:hypothetical protein